MGNTDIEHSETLRRKRRAYQARIYESKSLAAIGDELGVTATTVLAWIREQMVINLPPEEEEHLRQVDVAKIDRDEENAMFARELLKHEGQRLMELGKSVEGVIESMRRWDERLAALRQERAKLLGLNKPIAVHHKHTVRTEYDAELEELTAALAGGGVLFTQPDEVEVEDIDATPNGK